MSTTITPPPKPDITLKQLGSVLAGSFLIANIYYFVLRGGISGLRLLVLNAAIVTTSLILAKAFNKSIDRYSKLLIGSLALISIFSVLRSSSLLTFLNTFSSMAIISLLGFSLSGIKLKEFTIPDYIVTPLVTWIGWVGGLFKLIQQTFRIKRQRRLIPKLNEGVVRGVLLAAPMLLLFGILFASADEQFASLFSFDIDLNISDEIAAWIFYTGWLFTFFAGAFTYFALLAKPLKKSHALTGIGQTESLIVAGSLMALFAGFAILQLNNTLLVTPAAELAELAPNARRGFGQLMFASFLLFTLLLGLEKTKFEEKKRTTFLLICGGLVVSTFVILASAMTRLMLYEQSFGFTLTRFLTHAFMILLALWLGMLFVKIYGKLKDNQFALALSVSMIGFVGLLNVISPDAIITRQNLRNTYDVEIDYHYIDSLSTDAFSVISEQDFKQHPAIKLSLCRFAQDYKTDSLLDWNASEIRAELRANDVCKDVNLPALSDELCRTSRFCDREFLEHEQLPQAY